MQAHLSSLFLRIFLCEPDRKGDKYGVFDICENPFYDAYCWWVILFLKDVNMNILGEALGYFAGICTAIVLLPQALQTIKERNVSGLSLPTYIIYCLGMISWILYGVYMHSVQMVLFNSISLVLAAIILYLIIEGKRKKG